MLSLIQTAIAIARLASATIQVELTDSGATVVGLYRFDPAPDTVRLVLIRLPGRRADRFAVDGASITEEPGLWRIAAPPDGEGTLRISYQITGPSDRLPVPVPSVATGRDDRRVGLRIKGLDPMVRIGDTFPRLAREATGDAVGALGNVPSVIHLGRANGFRWLRLLEAGVTGLILIGSIGWYQVYRRSAAR